MLSEVKITDAWISVDEQLPKDGIIIEVKAILEFEEDIAIHKARYFTDINGIKGNDEFWELENADAKI